MNIGKFISVGLEERCTNVKLTTMPNLPMPNQKLGLQ